MSDQPSNAAAVSDIHNIGYELFEVRSGPGLRPVRRLGDKRPTGTAEAVRKEALDIFTKSRGMDGRIKREKAEYFREQARRGWEAGGEAWSDLRRLVNVLS